MGNQQGNVLSSLTKRRDFNGEDIKSIKKILAELLLSNHGPKIAMGRGDDSHIDMDRFGTPQTFELLLLNGTQQLWLQFQADVADFIEKKRTMIGELESAFLLHQGSSESPFLVSKQFTFQQSRGNRSTVHSHQHTISPRAEIMNCACNHFFARSSLAVQKHRRVGRRNNGDLFQHFVQRFAFADDVLKAVFRPYVRSEAQPCFLIGSDTLPDGIQQFFIVDRLRQEVCGACFDRVHCHWDVAVACEEYDGDLNIRFGKLLLQVESAYPGKIHIQHQTTWHFRPWRSQELLP